jgi:hypothetical protein
MNTHTCRMLITAFLLIASAGATAAGQTDEPEQRGSSLTDRIGASETAIFGSTNEDRPLLQRVFNMEIRLYGKPQPWSLPQALSEIERTIQDNPAGQPFGAGRGTPQTFQAYSNVSQFTGSNRNTSSSSNHENNEAAQKELNQRIVGFCGAQLGQTVGGGECANLVEEAFRAAGAKPEMEFQEAPDPGDYVWGNLIFARGEKSSGTTDASSVSSIRTGDVVQLRNARFYGATADGRGRYNKMTMGHHTAVVASIRPDGQTISVYEQNMNGNRTVTMGEYNLSDLKRGWVRVYRPVPN